MILDSDLERDNFEIGDKEQLEGDSDSDEENIGEFEINALRNLCEEMVEEVFDETSFHLNCELNSHIRKGFHAKLCLRKTCKVRRANFSKMVPR
jgi:hypothetical protein